MRRRQIAEETEMVAMIEADEDMALTMVKLVLSMTAMAIMAVHAFLIMIRAVLFL